MVPHADFRGRGLSTRGSIRDVLVPLSDGSLEGMDVLVCCFIFLWWVSFRGCLLWESDNYATSSSNLQNFFLDSIHRLPYFD